MSKLVINADERDSYGEPEDTLTLVSVINQVNEGLLKDDLVVLLVPNLSTTVFNQLKRELKLGGYICKRKRVCELERQNDAFLMDNVYEITIRPKRRFF